MMRKALLVVSCIATAFFTAAVTWWIIHTVSTSSLRPSHPALPVTDADAPPAQAAHDERFSAVPVADAGPDRSRAVEQGFSPAQHDATPVEWIEMLSHFSGHLQAYSTGNLDHEGRMRAEQILRDINATTAGRAFVVDTFFSADDPQRADALYNLILAADLKDVTLIDALVERDASEASIIYKARLLDLIADVSTREDAPFSSRVDDYLVQLTQHPEPSLREAAIARRAWYLAQNAKNNSGVLYEYLLAGGMQSRREIYELIDSRLSAGDTADVHELTLALESLMNADYLGVPPQEQEKVAALMEKLRAAEQ